MHMVGHYDEPANGPAVSLRSAFEFATQDGERLIVGQDWTPVGNADRQEIKGRFE